jgi:hypothetical protein
MRMLEAQACAFLSCQAIHAAIHASVWGEAGYMVWMLLRGPRVWKCFVVLSQKVGRGGGGGGGLDLEAMHYRNKARNENDRVYIAHV